MRAPPEAPKLIADCAQRAGAGGLKGLHLLHTVPKRDLVMKLASSARYECAYSYVFNSKFRTTMPLSWNEIKSRALSLAAHCVVALRLRSLAKPRDGAVTRRRLMCSMIEPTVYAQLACKHRPNPVLQ